MSLETVPYNSQGNDLKLYTCDPKSFASSENSDFINAQIEVKDLVPRMSVGAGFLNKGSLG